MLVFNPKRMFAMRGIDKAHTEMVKLGLAPGTATKLLQWHSVRLTVEHIEKICVRLNCTPNDLFEWRDDTKTALAEKHSLNTLKREGVPPRLSEIIKDFPVEKLAQVEKVLRDLENQE